MTASRNHQRLRLGLVGLGAAGRAFLPAVLAHDRFDLAAVAEPGHEARSEICGQTGVGGFESLPAMLAGCDLDAVYIGTPTELHGEHVMLACAAGKHVLTEKPMSTSLDGAQAMVAAAERAGVALLVGHSHSYDLPIKTMREIIAGGGLGRLRMIHTWCFSDWIYRPRRPDELNPELGGGVIYRQGAHQFDIIRLLGGGLLKSVRATAFDWDPERKSIGAHVAWLQFADGATATAVYNGYGHLPGTELCFDVGEWGQRQRPEDRMAVPRAPLHPDDEIAAKRRRAKNAIPAAAPFQPFFGLTIVSCDHGDLRQSPHGLYLYTGAGREEIVLPPDCNPRSLVLDEFAAAILDKVRAVHDGRWGLATLEICAAVLASSQSGREVELMHQVAVQAGPSVSPQPAGATNVTPGTGLAEARLAAPAGGTAAGERPFRVRLARSGRLVEVASGCSILDALRRNGIDVPSSCEAGTCGTCRTRLIAGEADHRDYVLGDDEHATDIMICVSRARSDELTIDL